MTFIVAHRGESHDAPENTLAAFRLAWERGDEAVELDVYRTKDGHLVCCHDPDTGRTTGESLKITEATLEQIKALDAGRWMDERWAGEPIPTLDEALATLPIGGRFFIEIKGEPAAPPGTVAAVAEAVAESGKPREQFVIISFDPGAIAETKRSFPELTAYLLIWVSPDAAKLTSEARAARAIDAARACRADGVSIGYHDSLDREYVDRIKQAGLGFYVWTIDDVENAQRMLEANVDSITTNRAAWLRDQLAILA